MSDSDKIKKLVEALKEYSKLINWTSDADKTFYINTWKLGNGYDLARKVLKEIEDEKI